MSRIALPHPLPYGYSFLCMNLGIGYTDDPDDQTDWYLRNGRELYDLGIRKLRLGGTSPQYVEASEFATVAANVAILKNIGFTHVESGTTHLNGVDAELTAANWGAYHDYALSLAESLYASDLDAFMMGNEMLDHVDGTTLTNDQMYTNFVQLASDIHDECPDMIMVYNGTANEMATWSTWIGTHGAIPAYMKLGFNLYGSSATDVTDFKTQVDAVVALDGYISEWSQYHDWTAVPFDEDIQFRTIASRLEILRAANIDAYYWVWKYYNKNAASDWNKWALKKSNANPASPQVFDTSFYTRSAFYALFAHRRPAGNNNSCMGFSGSSYAVTPITPGATGISLAFWYNRQRFLSSNAEHVIGNLTPTDGYINGFRIYNDQASKNLVLQVASATVIENYNTVATQPMGAWTHIAVTITSSGALLYINGVLTGSSLPGDIGTPTRALVVGARPIDYEVGGQFLMSHLTIENTATAWTQQEIDSLRNSNTIPTGATQWDLNRKSTDQNGINALTLSATSYGYGAPTPPRTTVTSANPRFTITTGKSLLVQNMYGGDDGKLSIPITPSATGFNFALYMRLNDLGNNEHIFDWTDASSNHGFRMSRSAGVNSRNLYFILRNNTSTVAQLIYSNIIPGQWFHFAYTYKVNEAKLYVNAVLTETDTSCTMTDSGVTPVLGRGSGSKGNGTSGYFKNFVFHNTDTPWTQAEVLSLYRTHIAPSGAQVYYSFNDNVLDSSGNGNNGTLVGGSYTTILPIPSRTAV